MVYTWLLLDVLAREEQEYEYMRCEYMSQASIPGITLKER